MRNGSGEESAVIKHAIENGGLEDLATVLSAVQRTGALQHVRQIAENEAELACKAIEGFADSPYKQAMITLARFAANRNY
jgi:octaprenyl-diphosphate synthase